MEIREADIEHFGKFENQVFSFYPGINIIYGMNESGKSTIHAFIRDMLFGIDPGRRGRGKADEYTLREPWDNPAWFSGVLRVEQGGRTYRIERSFSRGDRRFALVREDDGKELSADSAHLRALLGGLSESAFRNTVFISQAGTTTDEGLAEELRRYLVNISGSGEGNLNLEAATQSLKKRKKELSQENRQLQKEAEEAIARKKLEYEYAGIAARKLEMQMEEAQRQKKQDQAVEMAREQAAENSIQWKRFGSFLLLLFGLIGLSSVLSFCCMLLLGFGAAGIFMGIFGAGLLILAVGVMRYYLSVRPEMKRQEAKVAIPRAPENDAASIKTLEGEHAHALLHCRKLQEELQALEAEADRRRGSDVRLEAIDLAQERIAQVSSSRYTLTGMRFMQEASDILSQITGGRYQALSLDEQMKVRVNTPDKLLHLHSLSYGTMNQIYFAIRMAAGELLSDKSLPIILDETFAMYDDERLRETLKWLEKKGRQVILFTCQSREKQILEEIHATS